MPHRPIKTFLIFIILLIFALPAIAQRKPFTHDQVQSMLAASLADESGAELIEQRGIDFVPTAEFLQSLKTAGATESFIQALRSAKPWRAGETDIIDPSEQSYYLGAKPLLDRPLQNILWAVPELHALEPSGKQDELAFILDKTGKVCEELMQRMPNVISREEVTQEKLRASGAVKDRRRRKFDYLILAHRKGANVILSEYRTGRHGSSEEAYGSGQEYMLTRNFASQWLHFSPRNQSAARYLYIGQQPCRGLNCYVVAFAQKPGSATVTGRFIEEGTSVCLLYQGVAWIDKASFRIVRLRTDLLAPRPDVGLESATTELQFGMTRLRNTVASFWLPEKVVVTAERNNQRSRNTHRYSDYRLFRVKAKLLPVAANKPQPEKSK